MSYLVEISFMINGYYLSSSLLPKIFKDEYTSKLKIYGHFICTILACVFIAGKHFFADGWRVIPLHIHMIAGFGWGFFYNGMSYCAKLRHRNKENKRDGENQGENQQTI